MTALSDDPGPRPAHTVRILLQFLLGVGLLAYSVALWTDAVSFRPPAFVYLLAGVALLGYGVWLLLRD